MDPIMASTDRCGKIQTVLGCVDPQSITGYVLPHEHLSSDFSVFFVPPPNKLHHMVNLPFELQHISTILRHPYHHKPNLKLYEEKDAIVEEMKLFKKNGGEMIVELTTIGIKRDVEFYKDVAMETGLKVIAGAGYFTDFCHPPTINNLTEEDVYEQIVQEVTKGCDGTDIKCGIIGEIGCSWPLTDNERKVLRAAGHAQGTLGSPINIHPGRNIKAPFEILRILQEVGANVNMTVMSHLDRTFPETSDLLAFATTGAYCEFDLFGIENAWNPLHPDVPMPNDGERIRRIQTLLKEGHEDKVLIAQDIDTKSRLLKYGGHGFSHILDIVVPQMIQLGIPIETIDKIMKENATKSLTFTK